MSKANAFRCKIERGALSLTRINAFILYRRNITPLRRWFVFEAITKNTNKVRVIIGHDYFRTVMFP